MVAQPQPVWNNSLEEHHGQKLSLANIPQGDEATYDMLCAGDSVGVFQVESRAQMSMLGKVLLHRHSAVGIDGDRDGWRCGPRDKAEEGCLSLRLDLKRLNISVSLVQPASAPTAKEWIEYCEKD